MFGMVFRTTRTAAHTSVKAISVPMLVISPARRAGTNAASRPTISINRRLLRAGVRNFSLMCEKKGEVVRHGSCSGKHGFAPIK